MYLAHDAAHLTTIADVALTPTLTLAAAVSSLAAGDKSVTFLNILFFFLYIFSDNFSVSLQYSYAYIAIYIYICKSLWK